MKLIGTIKHPSRIQDLRFYTREEDLNEVLLVGAEDKKVTVYNLGASDSKPDEQVDEDISGQRVFGVIAELVGHTNRFVISSLYVRTTADSRN
jgi:protein MAK11